MTNISEKLFFEQEELGIIHIYLRFYDLRFTIEITLGIYDFTILRLRLLLGFTSHLSIVNRQIVNKSVIGSTLSPIMPLIHHGAIPRAATHAMRMMTAVRSSQVASLKVR